MPTHKAERTGNGRTRLGDAARRVAEHASALARLELELAGLELKRKLGALALGIGLVLAAAVFVLLAVGFGLATAAAALATAVSTWLALLIVTGGALLLAAVLGAVGLGAIRKGSPPVPEQALEEARRTGDALKSNGR